MTSAHTHTTWHTYANTCFIKAQRLHGVRNVFSHDHGPPSGMRHEREIAKERRRAPKMRCARLLWLLRRRHGCREGCMWPTAQPHGPGRLCRWPLQTRFSAVHARATPHARASRGMHARMTQMHGKNAWHARNSPSPRARVNPACISVHAGSKQRPNERNQRRRKQMLAPIHAPRAKPEPHMHACNTDAPQTRCTVEQRAPHANVASFPRLRVRRLDLAARGTSRGRLLRLLLLCFIGGTHWRSPPNPFTEFHAPGLVNRFGQHLWPKSRFTDF